MEPLDAVAALVALGHELRLRVWHTLNQFGPVGLPAGQISTRLSIPPSSLSFHLHQMTLGKAGPPSG